MDRDLRFGQVLRHLRKTAELTQEELAERANLSVRAISDLERGLRTVPQRETVELLAQALHVPSEQLEASVRRRRGPPPPSISPGLTPAPPLTSLLGREHEQSRAVRLLQREEMRLLTLVGPGGVGKTRLALQVGAECAGHFQDGVVLVELAPIRDVHFVLPAIAAALGVHESGSMPLLESVTIFLHGRTLLLVLDNCEHLLDAGTLVVDLLVACPGLSVLATSREPFHLRGEHRLEVLPLAVPDQTDAYSAEELAQFPSVALFLERAHAIAPDPVLDDDSIRAIAEICRRLDGLPLAVELAASRITLFPPKALLDRLSRALPLLTKGPRDAPIRQQTLRDTIDWSHQLLAPDEQRLFARLSVFAGGWTLEAAGAICADGDLDILEGIGLLVDKSLVRQEGREEPRFAMLETVREFAQEQLEATREAQTVRRRHAEHFLAMAREAELDLPGRNQARWLTRLNREIDNLRTALAWWRDRGEIDVALEMAGALAWFWYDGGHWAEGRAWLESLLTLDTPPHLTPGRAAALTALGGYNRSQSNFEVGRAHFEESLAIWRELDDARGTGRSLTELAVIVAAQGDAPRARALSEESLALAQEAGDQSYIALALHSLGVLAGEDGDEDTARSRLEESRGVWQELGNTGMLSLASNSLGDLARSRGQFAEAAAYYRESLELAEDSATQHMQAVYRHNLAHATHRLGNHTQARDLFAQALSLFRELGDQRGLAECVAGLAGLVAESEPERTARLFGATSAIIGAMGSRLNPSNQADYHYALAIARARLGDDAFDAAWVAGRSLTLEQALAEAVRERAPS
jgi:predicted ATPase/DNA-binding XRE family transcriptional regulator